MTSTIYKYLKYLLYFSSFLLIALYLQRILITKYTIIDDAYMFIRYANNLLNGYGFAWNRDHINTFGCTSITYTFLITLLLYIFPHAEFGVFLVLTSGTIGLILIFTLVYSVIKAAKSEWLKQFPFTFMLIAPFLIINPAFLFHAKSGMDTMLALLTNTLLIFSTITATKNSGINKMLAISFFAYLTFLTRPDNLIYSILFPILFLFLCIKIHRKMIYYFILFLFSFLLIDTIVKWYFFSSFLPLTYFAKKSGYLDDYIGIFRWNPISYISQFFLYNLPFIAIIFFTFLKKSYSIFIAFFVPLIFTFLYYFSAILITGIYFRFYFPSIPFVIIASLLCLDIFLADFSKNKFILFQQYKIRLLLLILFLISIILGNGILADIYRDHFLISPARYLEIRAIEKNRKNRIPWFESIQKMNRICKKLPLETVFAATEHGLIGAESPGFTIIDIVGLHDPYIAHNGFSASYLFSKKPDLIWMPHSDYPKIISQILNNSYFKKNYILYPDAINYGIAVRRDREDIKEIIEKELNGVI